MYKGLCKNIVEWANSRLGESLSDLQRAKLRLGEYKDVNSMIKKTCFNSTNIFIVEMIILIIIMSLYF